MAEHLNFSGEPQESEREFLERFLRQVEASEPTNTREREEKMKFLELAQVELDRAKVREALENNAPTSPEETI